MTAAVVARILKAKGRGMAARNATGLPVHVAGRWVRKGAAWRAGRHARWLAGRPGWVGRWRSLSLCLAERAMAVPKRPTADDRHDCKAAANLVTHDSSSSASVVHCSRAAMVRLARVRSSSVVRGALPLAAELAVELVDR